MGSGNWAILAKMPLQRRIDIRGRASRIAEWGSGAPFQKGGLRGVFQP